jgi:hypothetical protein
MIANFIQHYAPWLFSVHIFIRCNSITISTCTVYCILFPPGEINDVLRKSAKNPSYFLWELLYNRFEISIKFCIFEPISKIFLKNWDYMLELFANFEAKCGQNGSKKRVKTFFKSESK